MRREALAAALLCTLTVSAQAAESEVSGQDILTIAKTTGSCEIMDSLAPFQSSAKLPGGDQFVARFWSAVAARRGMTVEQFTKQCADAVATFDRIWDANRK